MRYRDRFEDPEGLRHSLPTWPFGAAPQHLATRRQLRAAGLAPGGHSPVGRVMWRSRLRPDGRPGDRFAWLYDIRLAAPKRVCTTAQAVAVAKALAARRTCSTCGEVRPYEIPRSLGECPPCAGLAGAAA